MGGRRGASFSHCFSSCPIGPSYLCSRRRHEDSASGRLVRRCHVPDCADAFGTTERCAPRNDSNTPSRWAACLCRTEQLLELPGVYFAHRDRTCRSPRPTIRILAALPPGQTGSGGG